MPLIDMKALALRFPKAETSIEVCRYFYRQLARSPNRSNEIISLDMTGSLVVPRS